MARSTYIYIVMQKCEVLAAFTVKHEMETWIERQDLGEDYIILRALDNPVYASYGDRTAVTRIDAA